MKRQIQNFGAFLEQSFSRFHKLPPAQVGPAWNRVIRRLREEPEAACLETPFDTDTVGTDHHAWRTRWSLALAGAVVAISLSVALWPGDAAATVEGSNIKIYYGEATSATRPGEVLLLADGSRAEVREASEFTLERATDGVRMRLHRGGVIVSAVKQPQGRYLHVQTKDVTVSVEGTVFLVNTEEEGSRVAVIEGEVRVKKQESSEKLLPGEQVATNPAMDPLTVRDEISWSPNAEAHLALLEQALSAPAAIPEQALRFAVASIRPHSGSSDGVESLGLVCHGIDGVRRAFPEDIGLSGRLVAPLGRCRGAGVFLQSLVAFAYGIAPRDVAALPDWAIASGIGVAPGQSANAFQIDAAADDPSAATAEELRQMLQTLLADRFKLRVHRETQDVSGYALVVSKNGPKPMLKKALPQEELPVLDSDSSGQPVIRGKSTMDRLTQFLNGSLGVGGVNLPVVNKTGLEGTYEYEFRRIVPRLRGDPPPGQTKPTLAELQRLRTENLSDAMDGQLGLRLEPEKGISVDVVVVDHVERPSPN
jgi:uncharacterized protein (TIGR03435 family)